MAIKKNKIILKDNKQNDKKKKMIINKNNFFLKFNLYLKILYNFFFWFKKKFLIKLLKINFFCV